MTNSTTELGNRTLFHWRGADPSGFVASQQPNDVRLADKIAEVVPNLFCRGGGSLAYLGDDGQIIGANPDRLKEIIAAHIAYVTLVQHNGGWRREYHSYSFAPRPRFNPTAERPTEPEQLAPDSQTLNDLFRTLLPLRLPRMAG